MTDALDWPARQGEEAIRQLDMLRHTLRERIADRETLMREMARDVAPIPHATYRGAWEAYRDVLALLGPEPAWTTDEDGEPF